MTEENKNQQPQQQSQKLESLYTADKLIIILNFALTIPKQFLNHKS